MSWHNCLIKLGLQHREPGGHCFVTLSPGLQVQLTSAGGTGLRENPWAGKCHSWVQKGQSLPQRSRKEKGLVPPRDLYRKLPRLTTVQHTQTARSSFSSESCLEPSSQHGEFMTASRCPQGNFDSGITVNANKFIKGTDIRKSIQGP